MSGICFYFENNDIDVWSGRNIDLDAWNYASKLCPDINNVLIINRTDIKLNSFDSDLNTEIVDELPELNNSIYISCPWDKMSIGYSLWDFNHKNIDWYIFGPAAGWEFQVPKGLYIPQDGKGAHHSVFIAPVIMFDRYHKLFN